MCPVLIWQDIIYLPQEHYCSVSFKPLRGFLWSMFISYGFPLCCLLFIYIRIIFYLQQQPNNVALAIQRRQKRDLVAIQRILINVALLLAIGLPFLTVFIVSFANGQEHPLIYRISWIGSEVSVAVISVGMIFVTPQLKTIVLKRWKQNRVIPIQDASIQMGPMTTAPCL